MQSWNLFRVQQCASVVVVMVMVMMVVVLLM
jgi:hypothetical protein